MSPRPAAGWYADPGEPGQLRWWTGSEWSSDTVAPAASVEPEAVETVDEPVFDFDGAAERAPHVHRFVVEDDRVVGTPAPTRRERRSQTPKQYVITVPPEEQGTATAAEPTGAAPVEAPVAPSAPAAAPPASAPGIRSRPERSGNTVWVWLVVLFGALPPYLFWLVDGVGIVRTVGSAFVTGGADGRAWAVGGFILLVVLGLLSKAVAIVFAFLDARALRRRGVERPLSGWVALTGLVVTMAGYLGPRALVLRRRGVRGTLAFVVWLVAVLLGAVLWVVWLERFVDLLWAIAMTR